MAIRANAALLLDLHVPDGAGPFPAAILIHGGGVDEGSTSTNVRPLFEPLASAGIAWFSIDYRMAPNFKFVDTKEDVWGAIRWVKANAAEVSPGSEEDRADRRIGRRAAGELRGHGMESADTKVAAVVDFYGPVDYGKLALARRDHPEMFNMMSINRHAANGGGIHFFGVDTLDDAGLKKLWSVAPLAAVHKGMPPFLCIHGTKDDQVLYEQTPALCDAMHKVGAVCDIVTIEGGGHGMSGWKAPEMQHWKAEMVEWLKKTLQ